MKINLFAILFLILAPTQLWAAPSAIRYSGEDYKLAQKRAYTYALKNWSTQNQPNFEETPQDRAVQIENLDISKVSEVQNLETLFEYFQYLRDTKFFAQEGKPIHNRRISWLYPDDGCFTRAMMMAHHIFALKKIEAKKIYAFGNLRAHSDYGLDGIVRWWYHVAISFKVDNQLYVFDPSVDFNKPLTVLEWKKNITDDDDSISFSICSADTYGPDDSCDSPTKFPTDSFKQSQFLYLDYEWTRLLHLKLVPQDLLGENPPWKLGDY